MMSITRIIVFTVAFAIGTLGGSVFLTSDASQGPSIEVFESSSPRSGQLKTSDLIGTWKGSWGYNSGDCSIKIERATGSSFSGTLTKEGAEIRFAGTFDPSTREVSFSETEVVRLGEQMFEWSLGENRGFISPSGNILYGSGVDKWGQHAWAVSL